MRTLWIAVIAVTVLACVDCGQKAEKPPIAGETYAFALDLEKQGKLAEGFELLDPLRSRAEPLKALVKLRSESNWRCYWPRWRPFLKRRQRSEEP